MAGLVWIRKTAKRKEAILVSARLYNSGPVRVLEKVGVLALFASFSMKPYKPFR
jgi:hypothetical protein